MSNVVAVVVVVEMAVHCNAVEEMVAHKRSSMAVDRRRVVVEQVQDHSSSFLQWYSKLVADSNIADSDVVVDVDAVDVDAFVHCLNLEKEDPGLSRQTV